VFEFLESTHFIWSIAKLLAWMVSATLISSGASSIPRIQQLFGTSLGKAVANLPKKLQLVYIMDWQFKSVHDIKKISRKIRTWIGCIFWFVHWTNLNLCWFVHWTNLNLGWFVHWTNLNLGWFVHWTNLNLGWVCADLATRNLFGSWSNRKSVGKNWIFSVILLETNRPMIFWPWIIEIWDLAVLEHGDVFFCLWIFKSKLQFIQVLLYNIFFKTMSPVQFFLIGYKHNKNSHLFQSIIIIKVF